MDLLVMPDLFFVLKGTCVFLMRISPEENINFLFGNSLIGFTNFFVHRSETHSGKNPG